VNLNVLNYYQDNFIDRAKNSWYRTIAEIQHIINIGTHNFWEERGLICMNLPVTTGTISSPMGLGSDSLPLRVNLAGVDTYLADSMQFALEYGTRLTERGCYYIMPSFRGEGTDPTHLSQFFHSEAELKCSLEDLIPLVEAYVKHLCKLILKRMEAELAKRGFSFEHIQSLVSTEVFPRVTFKEAHELIGDEKFFKRVGPNISAITREGEQALIAHFGGVVWLTDMEHLSVPFYQAYAADHRYSKSADLLLGFGEVIGSGERHFSGTQVREALKHHRVGQKEYEWYVEMKDVLPLLTSGFGMGVERFIMWFLKHDDIRDIQILPREKGVNIYP
jgi:asparaginyl-tRNA synthetase